MKENKQDEQDLKKPDNQGEKKQGIARYCLIGWIVSAAIISGLMLATGNGFDMAPMVLLFSGILWIPITLIAGSINKKRGRKAGLTFVAIGVLITLFTVGGCFGSIIS